MSEEKNYRIAFSSHSFCFICKWPNKYVKLHKVKQTSIDYALREFNLIIKKGARCCEFHLNDKMQIKIDQFHLIPTTTRKNPKFRVTDFNFNQYSYVFELFNDLYYLDEKTCEEITGWSKEKFIEFCGFIKSIHNTKTRTKEQLIALYRFWLRKGLNENILARMFGKDISQQKISYYLSRIRDAINKDFVPQFLGTNKERKFYLEHNNLTASKLYNISDDVLVIVVDGTYCRIEKSANNQFQYSSWSEQKKDLLIKPFLITCADGWIIDCYGPFKANQNDAKIFEYILKTDKELMKILLKNKTLIFTDRAFRDSLQKLRENYGFMVKIPTCSQIESDDDDDSIENKKVSNQLSIKQTSETRFVTKCRFIVEKQIGNLKKFQALENIRNRQVGHIQIDYRIASSMINFDHKACCPDGDYSEKILKRMKKKSKKESNHLEVLIRKHLNETATLKKIKLVQIYDFPILTLKKLATKIFLGNYQLRLCRSYLSDVLKNGFAYQVTENLLKKLSTKESFYNETNSKIIAVEIPSRHARSQLNEKDKPSKELEYVKSFKKRYKVFIQYVPHFNRTKSILGYICTCKSGKKVVGCCVHVATIIYYFSYARFFENSFPAESLNSIFINMNENEPPNNPRHVRSLRKNKKILKIENDNTDDSEYNSDDQNENIETDEESVDENEEEGKHDIFLNLLEDLTFEQFKRRVPFWGGSFNYKKKQIVLTNTCTIDYFLFAFWFMSRIRKSFIEMLPTFEQTNPIKRIIEFIENENLIKAKEVWVLDIAKYSVHETNRVNLFGSQYEHFLTYMKNFQHHKLIQNCKKDCPLNGIIIREDSERIFFKILKSKITIYSCYTENCDGCGKKIKPSISFSFTPIFIFIEAAYEKIFVNDLPNKIIIDGKHYFFVGTTLSKIDHFIGVFNFKNNLYVVDDLGQKVNSLSDLKIHREAIKLSTTVSIYCLA